MDQTQITALKPETKSTADKNPQTDCLVPDPMPSELKFWRRRLGPSVACVLALLCPRPGFNSALGQVVLDGKFGQSGALTGPNYSITPEMGSIKGNNLFQSFAQFNLAGGEAATFSGPANIQNILSRVTGGNPSSINGTLRSDIVGANVFLINPSGIIFGPNAVVDVSGSFAASSADYLKLADGARFVAALDADDSGLSTAPVSAFGFLGNNSGNISLEQSTLQVQNGQTITVVGGDVSLDAAAVESAAGQVNIASVRGVGEVPSDLAGLNAADFKAAFPESGTIHLQNSSRLDASGDAGGRIVIRGGSLVVESSKIQANTTGAGDGLGIDVALVNDLQLLNGGQINSVSTLGLGAGGNISINASSVLLDGYGALDEETFYPSTQIVTSTGDLFSGGGPGKGGDIMIETGSLEMVNSAQISSASFGEGDAGLIEINASSVRMDALLSTVVQISANTQLYEGGGNAGGIVIRADTLEMFNGATMFAASFGSGQAGMVELSGDTINLNSGSIITAASFGSGSGGDVLVTANRLRIDGTDTLTGGPDFLTGIQAITTSFESPSPGGSIQINVDSLELDHMGSIFTSSYGMGSGGNIEVNAGNVTLANSSSIRAEGFDVGSAGTISIQADHQIKLTVNSAINTSAPGSSGGDISIVAGSEISLEDSLIDAQAGLDGGNVEVTANDLINLLRSTITGQADTTGSGFGNGGNLTINAPSEFLILNQSALISRSSFGNGGNIRILSDYFLQSASLIDASAPFGLPGTVSVTAPAFDLSSSLVGLPANLLSAETQLRPDCAIRISGDVSSFVVLGRGGLPIQPGGFIPSASVFSSDDAK